MSHRVVPSGADGAHRDRRRFRATSYCRRHGGRVAGAGRHARRASSRDRLRADQRATAWRLRVCPLLSLSRLRRALDREARQLARGREGGVADESLGPGSCRVSPGLRAVAGTAGHPGPDVRRDPGRTSRDSDAAPPTYRSSPKPAVSKSWSNANAVLRRSRRITSKLTASVIEKRWSRNRSSQALSASRTSATGTSSHS